MQQLSSLKLEIQIWFIPQAFFESSTVRDAKTPALKKMCKDKLQTFRL
jgi:hypothetical protein